ncbi:MAG: fused MFS/spermidine synthase [Pirellulaceae bacterium]|nr:fused MFS/spermidine synthase [Pirellulaceae bacterium]
MATTRVASHRSSVASPLIAGGCLFLTGFVALVCEICWIRKASLAFSAVLAVFFAGLALGSYVVGLYSPRTARPLRVYAWLEMGVGLWAILSPTLFSLTDAIYGTIYPHVLHSVPLLALARVVAVTIVILPATTLMGGSLPLFCRQYVQHPQRILRGVGVLYGLNTLGAVAGSAACGFWLIPHLGVNTSIYLAGLLNLLVSTIAFRLARGPALELEKTATARALSPGDIEPLTAQQSRPVILAWLFFGVGFVALAHEVLWTRYLSLWMPNTVYTYTLTLSVVLLGIVLGSLLAAAVSDRVRWRAGLFGAAQVASGVAVMMVMQLRPAWWGDWLNPVSVGRQLGVITLVMLLPAILSGLSFPLAVRLIVHNASETGSGVGRMGAVNMVGGIAGSLLAGFAALPWLGLQTTLFLTTGLSLFIGIVAWWTLKPGPSWRVRFSWAAISVLLWAAVPYFCRTQLPQDFLATEGTLVDYREGIGANVAVVRKGDILQLEINRTWQGQNRKNHQVMAAHIPALLHGDPKSVLVIGLGTGQTARSFLLHDIQRLDCVEIEDGLVDLVAQHFESAWMNDPRVHLIVEDGRNYVTHTSDQYDLISIEVGQIYRPRVASFYTADFYERVRSRLRPGGLVCQFLPIEFFGPGEFRTLLATMLEVFPQSVLWYNTAELLLIGTEGQQFRLDPDRLKTRIADDARLKQELDYAYWGGPSYYLSRPEVFLAGFLCGPEQLQEVGEGGDIYRDDRPYLEYVGLLGATGAEDTVALVRSHLSPLRTVLEGSSADSLTAVGAIRRQNLQSILAQMAVSRGQDLEAAGLLRDAALEYGQALRAMPDHPRANFRMAALLQSQRRPRDAMTFYRRGLATKPDDVQARHRLAVALAAAGETAQAEQEFRQLLAAQPDHAAANFQLGTLLQAAGRLSEAADHYETSLRSDPDQVDAHVQLAGILFVRQRPEEAIRHYQEALKLDRRSADVHVRLGWALATVGRLDEALEHFRKTLELAPQDATALGGAAWILATHPDSNRRDPEQAVAWAESAWQETRQQDPQVADVLAAAYAAAGRFEQAVHMAEQALQLANSLQKAELAARIQERLTLYRQRQPFVQ